MAHYTECGHIGILGIRCECPGARTKRQMSAIKEAVDHRYLLDGIGLSMCLYSASWAISEHGLAIHKSTVHKAMCAFSQLLLARWADGWVVVFLSFSARRCWEGNDFILCGHFISPIGCAA